MKNYFKISILFLIGLITFSACNAQTESIHSDDSYDVIVKPESLDISDSKETESEVKLNNDYLSDYGFQFTWYGEDAIQLTIQKELYEAWKEQGTISFYTTSTNSNDYLTFFLDILNDSSYMGDILDSTIQFYFCLNGEEDDEDKACRMFALKKDTQTVEDYLILTYYNDTVQTGRQYNKSTLETTFLPYFVTPNQSAFYKDPEAKYYVPSEVFLLADENATVPHKQSLSEKLIAEGIFTDKEWNLFEPSEDYIVTIEFMTPVYLYTYQENKVYNIDGDYVANEYVMWGGYPSTANVRAIFSVDSYKQIKKSVTKIEYISSEDAVSINPRYYAVSESTSNHLTQEKTYQAKADSQTDYIKETYHEDVIFDGNIVYYDGEWDNAFIEFLGLYSNNVDDIIENLDLNFSTEYTKQLNVTQNEIETGYFNDMPQIIERMNEKEISASVHVYENY